MENKTVMNTNSFDVSFELHALAEKIQGGGQKLYPQINTADGSFDLVTQDGTVLLPHAKGTIYANGSRIPREDFRLIDARTIQTQNGLEHTLLLEAKDLLRWEWTLLERDHDLLVMAKLVNISGLPIEISRWTLLESASEQGGVLTHDIDNARLFKWHSWDMGVLALKNQNREFGSDNMMHISQASGQTVLSAFLTMSRMQTGHKIYCDAEYGLTSYRAELTFGNYLLPPDEAFCSELCTLCTYDDPYEALETWAAQTAAIYEPHLQELPPVGWNGGAWNVCVEGQNRDDFTMANAHAIRERLKGFDVGYIWISQASMKDYIPGNWENENRNEFPDGLKPFFEKLADLGYKGGLWVSPFWFFSEAEGMLQAHEDHLLCDASGEPICRDASWSWAYEDDSPWYHMNKYYLDGSHPKTMEYVKRLFARYRDMGVRYYMLDFLEIVKDSVLFDQTKTPQQAGCSMLKVVREAAGPDTHIQTAVSSSPGFAGIIDAARIGRDFGEGRPMEGEGALCDWRNANSVLHDLHYANTLYFLKNTAGSYFTHRTLYWNDLNAMTIDKPYPYEHAKIVTTLFGLSGSPIMLSDNYVTMDTERLNLVKMCLPRTEFSARPADLFERVQPEDYCRIMKLMITTQWDSYLLAGVFNVDDTPLELALDFSALGLDPAQKYVVYEYWNNEYLGVYKDRYLCQIPANSCKLYRIMQCKTHPWLMSTDMHIQQGAAEVTGLEWDESTKTLRGSFSRPDGERGNAYILAPKEFHLLNPAGKNVLKDLLDFNVIIKVPLHFVDGAAELELRFKDWEYELLAPKGLIQYSSRQEWIDYMAANYPPEKKRVFE